MYPPFRSEIDVSNASQMHGHDRALRCILQLQPPNAVCPGPSVMSFGSNKELQRGTKLDRPAAGLQPGHRICHEHHRNCKIDVFFRT